jgi:hypothetical protein
LLLLLPNIWTVHIFKLPVCCLCAMILPCNVVTRTATYA